MKAEREIEVVVRRVLSAISALAIGLAACGSSTSELIGFIPTNKSVAAVSGTEALPDGSTKPFSFKAQAGEVLVVYFGYTQCPDLCPTTMTAVRAAKKKIGPELAARVDLAMVTVDGARDTGAILTKYLSSFAERNHAITPADEKELEALKSAFQVSSSVTTNAEGKVEVTHSGTAYVVGPTGDVLVEWPFGLQAEDMAHDLRLVLKELDAETTQ